MLNTECPIAHQSSITFFLYTLYNAALRPGLMLYIYHCFLHFIVIFGKDMICKREIAFIFSLYVLSAFHIHRLAGRKGIFIYLLCGCVRIR